MSFKGMKKIWRVIERMIWAYLICGITFSLGYAQFCTDKIQAREQYLIDVSRTTPLPPKDAILKKEYMSRKLIFRMYCLRYTYEQSANEGIEYYKNELSKLGYTMKKLKENELEATNGDILIQVGYFDMQKELTIYIMFDDIFERLSI